MQKALFLFLLFLVAPFRVFASCHAVGPSASGNGSGSDWNNRMKLPSSPVRGDTYYLMDGSYGAYSMSSVSGTTLITIKKAQSYDYGRTTDGCTNDVSAGWDASTMGSSQAVFSGTGEAFTAPDGVSYVTIDGNGGTSATKPGCGVSPAVNGGASDCGFKFKVTTPSGGGDYGAIHLNPDWDGGVTLARNWTIRYVEMQGGGTAGTSVSGENEHTFWCRGGCSNLLMEKNYIHDSSCDFDKTPAGTNIVWRYNHWKSNYSSSNCHGQMLVADGNTEDWTYYNNLIQDIGSGSTAVWSIVNGGFNKTLRIYNNVIFGTNGTSNLDLSNGIVAVVNPGSTANVTFAGNTIINCRPDYHSCGGNFENSGTTVTWKNNLYYSCISAQGNVCVGMNTGTGASVTVGNNSYLNVGDSQGAVAFTAATDLIVTGTSAPSPFVNWPAYDFRLNTTSSDIDGASRTTYPSASLASPYNVDMFGSPRPGGDGIWNRGALEFADGQVQAVAAPTGLTALVQ